MCIRDRDKRGLLFRYRQIQPVILIENNTFTGSDLLNEVFHRKPADDIFTVGLFAGSGNTAIPAVYNDAGIFRHV